VKTVVAWVMALLTAIGAGVGAEAAMGVGHAAPASTTRVSALDDTLWAISQRVAIARGDPAAYDRQAVGPLPMGRAALLTTGDGPLGATEHVYVIELRGSFVCDGCPIPPGARAPTGDVSILYVDAATFESVGSGLGDIWYDLGRLGKAFPLVAPPGGLTPLQQDPAMAPYVGDWTSHSGLLRVTVTGGQLTYGRPACQLTVQGGTPCQSIVFQVTSQILSTNPPGVPRDERAGDCADDGHCGSAIGGTIGTNTVGLASGTSIVIWAELDDQVEVVVSGYPSVPLPSRWCGPDAPKAAC